MGASVTPLLNGKERSYGFYVNKEEKRELGYNL